jgi:hypothetical protein
MPILEYDSNIIEEMSIGSSKRFQRATDNADIIEKEEGSEFDSSIKGFRTCMTASIVDCVKSIKHLQGLIAIKTGRLYSLDKVYS